MASNRLHQPQTEEAWVSVLNSAKAAARAAIAINDPSKLTALGRAYYHKFKSEQRLRKQ